MQVPGGRMLTQQSNSRFCARSTSTEHTTLPSPNRLPERRSGLGESMKSKSQVKKTPVEKLPTVEGTTMPLEALRSYLGSQPPGALAEDEQLETLRSEEHTSELQSR